MDTRIQTLVTVGLTGSWVVLRVSWNEPPLLGLRIFDRQWRKIALRTLQCRVFGSGRAEGPFTAIFPVSGRDIALQLADQLRRQIAKVAEMPLRRSHVEEVLKISAQECMQWTKDGRLPVSGSVVISHNKQQNFHVATYSTRAIEALLENPERIATWRRQDRAAGSA